MGGLCQRKCVSDHFALSSTISFSWVARRHLHLLLCPLGKGVLEVSVALALLRAGLLFFPSVPSVFCTDFHTRLYFIHTSLTPGSFEPRNCGDFLLLWAQERPARRSEDFYLDNLFLAPVE